MSKGIRKIEMAPPYRDEEGAEALRRVYFSGHYLNGPELKAFEKEFAEFMGAKHAVAVNSCTSAEQLALLALGVGEGDEVLVPSHTAFPTIEPIIHVGASPIFVDIDDTYTINPEDLESKITDKSKAVIPVHLYGHPANMERIQDICMENDLYLIEDCAQAHNAEYNRQKVGIFGDAACYSFFPSKNMTGGSDGGLVLTNDDAVARQVRMLRNHGREGRYDHELVGFNMRMSDMTAALLRLQLKHLDQFTEARRNAAELYMKNLEGLPLVLPREAANARHVYHLFVVRTDDKDTREGLSLFLKDGSIDGLAVDNNVHYPIPTHISIATRSRGFGGNPLPITEEYVDRILSLPMHPAITEEEIGLVAGKIRRFYDQRG